VAVVSKLPHNVQDVLNRYRDGHITATARDAELTQLANADTRAAGLRNAAGVETRMVGWKPQRPDHTR